MSNYYSWGITFPCYSCSSCCFHVYFDSTSSNIVDFTSRYGPDSNWTIGIDSTILLDLDFSLEEVQLVGGKIAFKQFD